MESRGQTEGLRKLGFCSTPSLLATRSSADEPVGHSSASISSHAERFISACNRAAGGLGRPNQRRCRISKCVYNSRLG